MHLSGDEVGFSHLERLLQNQEREIEYLRARLSEEREARRRAEHTVAALTRRIPKLETPTLELHSAREAKHSTDGVEVAESTSEKYDVT